MPRKPIGEKAMTDAERQARYRVARAADAPVIRTRRPADHRSRARRWQDAVAQLCELQAQYADWLEALPANQHDSALAEALQAICELDLSELESMRPHAASDATDLPATNAQDKPTCRSERFPDAWPHHRRYPARGSPPGAHRYPPRYAPPAARRARRYARVPPMDSGDEPLPRSRGVLFPCRWGVPFDAD